MTERLPPLIEIDGGIETTTREWLFFVHVIEPDFKLCAWAGRTYDDAILEAEALRHDFGADHVDDKVLA